MKDSKVKINERKNRLKEAMKQNMIKRKQQRKKLEKSSDDRLNLSLSIEKKNNSKGLDNALNENNDEF